jgi:glycosyltransferase involved in cell wall biosynthesis
MSGSMPDPHPMASDPLHVLWVEPHFPGRLGAVADWLVRRRGYCGWFYCHTASPREHWPASVGRGLEVQTFGVGGVAREQAVAWSRALERSLCYSYGCWEVLESRRPRPIDLIVGRSAGLGSTLFAPVYAPAPPLVNLFEYYFHPRQNDLADELADDSPPAYVHWRRSANAGELLELEQCDLPWTLTNWQRDLYPSEYREQLWVQHDGIDTALHLPRLAKGGDGGVAPRETRNRRRSIAGRSVPAETRIVSFVARSLDRLRGLDRFWQAACRLVLGRQDVVCVIAGDPVVQRGLDIQHHNRDYLALLRESMPPSDPERIWLLEKATPAVVAEVLAAADLHVAPGRPYRLARSVLEAMAAGCIVLASDTAPHREVISHGRTGLLANAVDADGLLRQALAVLDDPAGHRPLGDAAAELVRGRFSHDACLPRIADRFSTLAASRRKG